MFIRGNCKGLNGWIPIGRHTDSSSFLLRGFYRQHGCFYSGIYMCSLSYICEGLLIFCIGLCRFYFE